MSEQDEALILDSTDSCMPTALNLYFGRRLFNSFEDFLGRQTQFIEKGCNVKIRELDSHLMLRARVGRHEYRKRIIFNTAREPKQRFPMTLPNGRSKAILHYRTITQPEEDHVETVKYADGQMIFIQYPELDTLPFTGMSVQEYVKNVQSGEMEGCYLNMFVYNKHW